MTDIVNHLNTDSAIPNSEISNRVASDALTPDAVIHNAVIPNAVTPNAAAATQVTAEAVRLDSRPDTVPAPMTDLPSIVDVGLANFVVPRSSRVKLLFLFGPLGALMAGGLVALLGPAIGVAFVSMVAVLIMVWNHPPIAGYAMIAGAPLIVGFGRDQVLPLLRPNEALLFALCALLGIRWLLYSRRVSVRLNRMDMVMLAVVFTGFLLPLLIQLGRLREVSADDAFYALVFVRIGLLYGIVRHTIRTPGQVRTALSLSLVAGVFVGILGTFDSLNLLGAAEKLNPYFPNDGQITDDGRGAATIGNPIGYGVYMAMNAMIAISMLLANERPRWLIAMAAVICSVGVFGSGQIGPSLSFLVGIAALALSTKSTYRLIRISLPALLVAMLVVIPLGERRINGFDAFAISGANRQAIHEQGGSDEGRNLFEANPGSSWDVRLYNLETFFLPEFRDPANVAFGVTPQARVASPREGEEFIWIESGILWLIWSGGVPLFLTWFGLLGVGAATARKQLSTVHGPVGIAAAATVGALAVVGVAMIFDPHMTLRGSADLLYPLLALMMTGWRLQKLSSQPEGDLAVANAPAHTERREL